MRLYGLLALALLVGVALATQEGYGRPAKKYYRGPAPRRIRKYAAQYRYHHPSYKYQSPFPPQYQHKGYGPTENYIPPTAPSKTAPYPFVNIPKDAAELELNLPKFSDYHCFLTKAPWGKCGRKSLTSYFLDQCIVLYYMLDKNVDGLCGGKPAPAPLVLPSYSRYYGRGLLNEGYRRRKKHYKRPQPAAPYRRPVVYKQAAPKKYNKKATAAPATKAPKGGYGGPVVKDYQKERCLQHVYVSITTAVVSCLTENMIRLKFIEHYAKHASKNPIQGPMLYLRKMHAFIHQVIKCNGKKAQNNYPNLWLTFKNDDDHITYNPHAPFYLDEDGNVALRQYTHPGASGLAAYTVGNGFLCSHPSHINSRRQYTTDPLNPHYTRRRLLRCSTASKRYLGNRRGIPRVIKTCQFSKRRYKYKRRYRGGWGPIGPHRGNQLISDMKLWAVYNSMGFVQNKVSALHRPMTIAEIATRIKGVVDQPILEGHGIMYFCAFYACKANTGGRINGKCLPEFDAEKDWNIPSSCGSFDSMKELSTSVNNCLSKKFLTKHDLAEDRIVITFRKAIRRSYICMAEPYHVRFIRKLYKKSRVLKDAMGLEYLRHLAIERCYAKARKACPSNRSLYNLLVRALRSLRRKCKHRAAKYYRKKKSYQRYQAYYQRQRHAYQQYRRHYRT